jgi:hypothetical protein
MIFNRLPLQLQMALDIADLTFVYLHQSQTANSHNLDVNGTIQERFLIYQPKNLR